MLIEIQNMTSIVYYYRVMKYRVPRCPYTCKAYSIYTIITVSFSIYGISRISQGNLKTNSITIFAHTLALQ